MVQLKPIISTALSSKRPPFRIKRAWRMQGRLHRLHRWLQVQGRTPRVVGAWGLGWLKTDGGLNGNIIGYWLVVSTILKNISQWEGLSHILWKIKNV